MPFKHPPEFQVAAVDLVRDGMRPVDAAAALGVSFSAVYQWLAALAPDLVGPSQLCFRCSSPAAPPARPSDYVYLLGLYLGDGCLRRHANGTYDLSISCDDGWPGLADECARALRSVSDRKVSRVARAGCHDIKAYWKHWPCLLPQHGPGKKHERRIALEDWQRALVEEHPGQLLRGLFHSDGWRGQNVAVHRRDGVRVEYRYPRYLFSSRSDDIRSICSSALELLDVAWRPVGRWTIAVSRREAVAALDEHVGPKY